MKQKKTMKIWQFILTECLLLLMLITMFLPLISITGSSVVKGTKKMFKKMDTKALAMLGIDDAAIDGYMKDIEEEIDEEIEEYEEDNNAHISSVSPLNIMTNSFLRLVYGDQSKDEDFLEDIKEDVNIKGMQSAYNILKVLLWVVYGLLLLVMIINIIGFCAKLVKYVTLSINTVYGLFAGIFFCYLRFGLIGLIAEKMKNSVSGKLGLSGLESIIDVKTMAKTILGSFYGMPFTVIILIGTIGFLICSILFMFIGNTSVASISMDTPVPAPNPVPPVNPIPVAEPAPVVNPIPVAEPTPVVNPAPAVNPTPVAEPAPAAKPAQPAMGQVRVVKGVAAGQGFMLPQERKVIVGKNPQKANLVIVDQHVSNIHCSIRYVAGKNSYLIKDHSSNGTFVNGVRLQKDMAMEYPAGTLLSLADGSNEILLG